MRKAIAYLRANPIMAGALAILIVAIVYFVLTSPRAPQSTVSTTPGAAPPPQPSMSPAMPASQAPPGGQAAAPQATPTPGPRAAAPSNAGRPDPFMPVVRGAGPGPRPGAVPAPPPAPLPPPLFPGPQQPQATPAASPPPPPKEASTAVLVGIVGDNGSVAIIRLGRETFIVSLGDVIKDKIKITTIDVAKSMVIIEQEGERFELRMGGVSGRNVAA